MEALLLKLFGMLYKHFAKKEAKQQLIDSITESFDTNHDGKITYADFAEGRWRDIRWGKLSVVMVIISVLVWGSFKFGFANLFW